MCALSLHNVIRTYTITTVNNTRIITASFYVHARDQADFFRPALTLGCELLWACRSATFGVQHDVMTKGLPANGQAGERICYRFTQSRLFSGHCVKTWLLVFTKHWIFGLLIFTKHWIHVVYLWWLGRSGAFRRRALAFLPSPSPSCYIGPWCHLSSICGYKRWFNYIKWQSQVPVAST